MCIRDRSNNVGRNCFRVYAIQQELAKARTLCVSAPAALGGPFPVLSRILAELADFEARGD